MKKVIVTAAAGFVGTNLTEKLLGDGYFVYAVVRENSPHNARLTDKENLKLVECDISRYSSLPELIADDCDFFFHLAWPGEHEDFETQNDNICYSLDALKSAKKLGCKRFVCTGSQAEYGVTNECQTEELLPKPVTAYGAAKVAACYLTKKLATQFGVEWVWGRIFSVYGKYAMKRILIEYLIETLKRGESPKMTAGTQSWDFIYSSDVAAAIVALGERGKDGEIYNIASGENRPLREYAEIIRNTVAPEIAIEYGAEQRNIVSLQPSVEKIERDTGWKAEASFAEGIKRELSGRF